VVRTDDLGQVNIPCRVNQPLPVSTTTSQYSVQNPGITVQSDTATVTATSVVAQPYPVGSGQCVNADDDGDHVPNDHDNCPEVFNIDQSNQDQDALGDVCDNCPTAPNSDQSNQDGDALGDVCDPCPLDPLNDADGDGRCANVDNCPTIANPTQADDDGDGIGDACDTCPHDPNNDPDGDLHCWLVDNCPTVPNHLQRDSDGDGRGDLCDDCPTAADPPQADSDGDGAGDACDCGPNDPSARRPANVGSFVVSRGAGGSTLMEWAPHAGDSSYGISRGELSALGPNAYGDCLVQGLVALAYEDVQVPAAGHGFFYLVQAHNDACGGWGPLGYTSSELERINGSAAACGQ
jgi:hypothetical protein